MDDRAPLIRLIASAFPNRPLPSHGIAVWEDFNGEDEEVRDNLAGRSWDTISDWEISQIPIELLTDEARAMLLPAIMTGVLRSGSLSFRIKDLMFDAEPGRHEIMDSVAERLNLEQRAVFAKYLQLASLHGDARASRVAEYWRQFLNSSSLLVDDLET